MSSDNVFVNLYDLNIAVSQGNAATSVRYGGLYNTYFVKKFGSESISERVLKIDQFFAKLSTWVRCLVFWLTVYTGVFTASFRYPQSPGRESIILAPATLTHVIRGSFRRCHAQQVQQHRMKYFRVQYGKTAEYNRKHRHRFHHSHLHLVCLQRTPSLHRIFNSTYDLELKLALLSTKNAVAWVKNVYNRLTMNKRAECHS